MTVTRVEGMESPPHQNLFSLIGQGQSGCLVGDSFLGVSVVGTGERFLVERPRVCARTVKNEAMRGLGFRSRQTATSWRN